MRSAHQSYCNDFFHLPYRHGVPLSKWASLHCGGPSIQTKALDTPDELNSIIPLLSTKTQLSDVLGGL